ncbi:MAG: MBL fold metallo-hydrolase [Bacteroides sp. SM23_62_1]|nr:MAG: MBL fold metallo-hydrolase [Bacteroides sp. SM23_62_1]
MFQIRTYVFNPFQVNTYIISDSTGACVIIDPGCENKEEEQRLTREITMHGLHPVRLINTHCHIDHVLGNAFVKNTFPVQFLIHQLEQPLLSNSLEQGIFYGLEAPRSPEPDQYINDGDRIVFGDSELEIIHLPGHSPGGVGLFNRNEKILFAGDVLFQNSIGRTDLPGGNYQTLMNSIMEKILVLDPDTVVYPGHGPPTDVGTEKRYNPFLK